MFKLLFGFIAGIIFSLATLIFTAFGVYMGRDLKNPPAKKPDTSNPFQPAR